MSTIEKKLTDATITDPRDAEYKHLYSSFPSCALGDACESIARFIGTASLVPRHEH